MILKYSTIDNRDNVLSLSEMYHDIFQIKRNMISYGDDWYKENHRQIKHVYILVVKFEHTFLVSHVSLSLVMLMIPVIKTMDVDEGQPCKENH